ncbi:hypothetical protein KSP35_00560 [Aquihabitans sp. G128]|uniref:DUF4129 domain-containing protein n=1 Tax=Aquihabitans sp. G128 TaxID=2849779 RepID=UPI001C2295E0|nr:hypothetical protein [Aquihabitans sp. G128]QXC61383.1 hypothetical protein KSP35_00560 [Aquihabitans sp. G128]
MAPAIADHPSRRRVRRLAGALLVLSCLLGGGASAAGAQDRSLTGPEAAALARDAATDDGALQDLRAVREVDGRPVDLAAATAGLGSQRAPRLRALAAELDGSAGGPDHDGRGGTAGARRTARQVLDDDKYHQRELPKPFRGPLRWLADRLRPVGRFLDRLVQPILDLPGGPAILVALFVGAGAALTAFLVSRRSRAAVSRSGRARLVDPTLDPVDLERRADAAEAAGDLAAALRWRHLAGLLRLARADRLVLRPDTTAAGAARQVDLPAMDRLTADFEEIVYGGREATSADLAAARAGWSEVLGRRPAEPVR